MGCACSTRKEYKKCLENILKPDLKTLFGRHRYALENDIKIHIGVIMRVEWRIFELKNEEASGHWK
jgi:hypothetical protein